MKFFSSATRVVENKLDIKHILQKLNEIEIMKKLIFDKNQIKLFSYLNKSNLQSEVIFLNGREKRKNIQSE